MSWLFFLKKSFSYDNIFPKVYKNFAVMSQNYDTVNKLCVI